MGRVIISQEYKVWHKMQFPKFKVGPNLIKFAYRFLDIEASGEAGPPDGRIIEYSFVLGKLVSLTKGRLLDVGCVARLNPVPATLAFIGWEVYGIDLRQFKFTFPNFHFVLGDITKTDFPDSFFDAVSAVSTLEHIGLKGRYGITNYDPEGDAKAVKEIRRILRRGGRLLVTLPFGEEKRQTTLNRVYNRDNLKELFSGWEIKDKIFYSQDSQGFWVPVVEEEAQGMGKNKEAIALLELALPK